MPLPITSLRGGLNDTDMPVLLREDQCSQAMNVEFFLSALGERRLGCAPIDVTGAGFGSQIAVVHLSEWFPDNNIRRPEHWAVAIDSAGFTAVIARRFAGAWTQVTQQDEIVKVSPPDIYGIQTQALNGKLFVAYPSDEDRLHVWDGSDLRRTGVAAPAAAPTAADTGSGTFSGTRYYRVRFIAEDADGVVVRRSEPSDVLTFTPSGSGTGAVVTRPAIVDEGETHWELEASDDNAFFFRIATTAIATTTATDSTDLSSTSYNDAGEASETSGDYLLQSSARFLLADGNRLILGSHWTDRSLKCRVSWSPVFADPGVGNDERQPLASGGDNYYDLDNYEGGQLTGFGHVMAGAFYAFKWGAIYRFLRTGDVNHAYEVTPISKIRGAMPGSIVNGVDELGRPCIYFLDASVGVCSLGGFGLREHQGLRNTWRRVTVGSQNEVVTRGLFHPDKQQVHWWVAVDGATAPNLKIVLQTNAVRSSSDGVASGGFSLADGLIARAVAVAIWHETTVEVDTDGMAAVKRLRARPFIGLAIDDDITEDEMIQRCDVQDDDNGVAYTASATTRPEMPAGTLDEYGAMTVGVLASPSDTAQLQLVGIRDFGVESKSYPLNLVPVGAESYVLRRVDDFALAEARAVQLQLTDG